MRKAVYNQCGTGTGTLCAGRGKGLFLMEGFWIRFLPVLQKMQELIKEGKLGEIRYIRSEYGFVAKGDRKVRKFNPQLGGGALLDIGIYNLGFLNMIMGKNRFIYQRRPYDRRWHR